MSIQRIQPGKRLSAAVVHGDTVYLAGQIAGDPSADVKGQTQQILKKIDDLLAAAGTSKSKLLSATIWLADMRYFEDMNSVWDAWMDPANPPLPTAMNFPFQFCVGSQSAILMSESGVGLRTSFTWQ